MQQPSYRDRSNRLKQQAKDCDLCYSTQLRQYRRARQWYGAVLTSRELSENATEYRLTAQEGSTRTTRRFRRELPIEQIRTLKQYLPTGRSILQEQEEQRIDHRIQ